jgi:hypothetical protein
MRMCKFLNKEWKLQFQKHLKQPDVTNSNNKDNKPDKGDDQWQLQWHYRIELTS